jgi:hypothetical protein
MENTSNHDRAGAALRGVEETIRAAAARYAKRFGIEPLREEIEAEATARVLALVNEGRTPFDTSVDGEGALDRMQRFTHGLVVNVAREALRGRVRHGHAPLEDRATACASLRAGSPAPEASLEMEEVISVALRRFRELSEDVRETIVAEEIMQNNYAGGEAGRLCRSCEVSFQRVWQMIENRKNGLWSAEAWRQRVHRSRKKARSAVGGLAPFAVAAALLVGLAAAAFGVAGPTRANHDRSITPTPVNLVDSNGSTQNGKAPIAVLASTQNGKANGKG